MQKILKGGCLCGEVKYSVKEKFEAFYLCHCAQCQRVTGSAFASNILTSVDNIEWVSGNNSVIHYQDDARDFSKTFCGICGSGVPYVNRNKTHLVIPAGSLFDTPSSRPQANLFVSESADWLDEGLRAKRFVGFPDQG